MSGKRLGKGIEALIRSKDDQKNASSKISTINTIPIKKIRSNPNQPRKKFNELALTELADSIKTKGVITPITVRKVGSEFEIVAGERRWRAAKISKKKTIPAYIINPKSDSEILEIALIENIQREDLNAIEESEAYSILNTQFNMSHNTIAISVGKKRTTISNSLRLLKLPIEIKRSLRNNQISAGHARAILQLKSNSKMIKLWGKVLEEDLSVRAAEAIVKQSKNNTIKKKIKIKSNSNNIISVQNKLIEILGTKIKIKAMKKGGVIEVSYFSSDDLERIVDLINSIP